MSNGIDMRSKSLDTNSAHEKERSRIVDDAVSTKLKAYYAELEKQKVPQHLIDLLNQLDKDPSK
jgi:DNA-binding protein Fis